MTGDMTGARTVGFLGLGVTGRPMAGHLLAAGTARPGTAASTTARSSGPSSGSAGSPRPRRGDLIGPAHAHPTIGEDTSCQ
jgi:hypothetical protein